MTKERAMDIRSFSLRLAQEGDWVRIVSVKGGKGFHGRLVGFGLRVGAEVQVLHNSMNGKLLLGHQGVRLYLGGGMAHKIQVAVIEGGNR
jgi:ferrous iron transport protein A